MNWTGLVEARDLATCLGAADLVVVDPALAGMMKTRFPSSPQLLLGEEGGDWEVLRESHPHDITITKEAPNYW